jgi:hypothetical protein
MRSFDSIRSGDLGHMKGEHEVSFARAEAVLVADDGPNARLEAAYRSGCSRRSIPRSPSRESRRLGDTGNDEVAIPASRLDDREWRALLRSPVRVRKRIGFRQLDNSGRARRPVRQRGPASLDARGCGMIGLFAAEARFVSPFSVWSTPEGGDRARRRVSNRSPGPGCGRHLRAVGQGPEGSEQTRLAVT